MNKSKSGFTIVELLIVIVVIGILATITVVSYSGIQGRAYDAKRIGNMDTITKALELYRIGNNQYPAYAVVTPSPLPYTDWEFSIQPNFLSALQPTLGRPAPTDPKNTVDTYYRYHRYTAGEYGCDPTKGSFYVIQIINEKNTDPNANLKKKSPGFVCTGRNWSNDGNNGLPIMWTSGSYEY